MNNLRVFTGNANPELSREIVDILGIKLGDAEVGRFPDGEVRVKIKESVRGMDVFIIQPTSPPVNENLMELLVMIDAIKRASAKRITVVMPFYGYAKQDRKTQPREPISAKLVANLITSAGASRILTMDLHAGQIQGFFDIPVDHLVAEPIISKYIKDKNYNSKDIVVVSPDVGGTARARSFSARLNTHFAVIDKYRPSYLEVAIEHIVGDVKGKIAILVDDMIDTAGSITKGAEALKKEGVEKIIAAATHPVFSHPARERLMGSPIEEIIVTNTIPIKKEDRFDKLTILSVAPLFAEAIKNIHFNESVSKIFE